MTVCLEVGAPFLQIDDNLEFGILDNYVSFWPQYSTLLAVGGAPGCEMEGIGRLWNRFMEWHMVFENKEGGSDLTVVKPC